MSQSFPFVSRIPGNNVKTPNKHGFSLASSPDEKTAGVNGTKPGLEPKRKVIVVGAGIAGLRAASVLYRHGVEVVVLEGRDRIGGRVWTVRGNASGNSRAVHDMGAAWLHETARSPLNKLIRELGLTYYYDDGTPLYYTKYGRTGAQFKAEKAAEEYVHYAEWYYEMNPHSKDRSVDSFIKKYVDQHELMSRDEKLWAPQALKNCEHMLGTTTAEASAKHLYYFAVPRDLYVKEGYDSITEWTAKALKSDGETLQLNRVVEHIDWNEDGPVRVRYQKADNHDADTMVADAVVVTTPLGSLHHHLISFSPSLPNDIEHGISKFSYGALGKVFFEFSEIFWSKENDQFIYYPPPAEIRADNEDSSNPGESSPEADNILNYATTTINLSLVTENSKELCVQIVEPLTQRIEAMSHRVDEIYQFFLPLFKLLRTETYKALPDLVNIAVTNWTQDPLAGFGTFSTEKVGDDPALLLQALENHSASRLQFAGDHCADVGSGCVHGAFSSGEVAATNLLDSFGIPYDGGDLVTVKCDVESDEDDLNHGDHSTKFSGLDGVRTRF